MLILIGFVLLTIVLVVALDSWAANRADEEVAKQSNQVKDAVNDGFTDFELALGMAIHNLASDTTLYRQIEAGEIKIPDTIQHIIVADKYGNVSDSTLGEQEVRTVTVPEEEDVKATPIDPVESEMQLHGEPVRTYNFPFMSSRGLYWIIIVTKPQSITSQIDTASKNLAAKSAQLSNVRLLATAGLLILALGIAVVIGWRFTRPVGVLAAAARQVAAGHLNFRVPVTRRDEIGQLATTFNEMIEGLESKRELEERLNQTERAAVIGRITQAVAHEIRNPLNVINLSIDHVSNKYAPEDESKRAQLNRMLGSIKDEISRLNRMLSDLLNYGRPAGLAFETVNLRDLVKETLSLIKPQADEQHVQMKLETDGSSAEVLADRERLKSCLSNIAINALQAMPAGGSLQTHVQTVNGHVEVAITDSGSGISEDALTKIFEPYYSTKQSGFGLGLAVTKWIIEQHRGSIEVNSKLNQGTTFVVRLPSAESTVDATVTAAQR